MRFELVAFIAKPASPLITGLHCAGAFTNQVIYGKFMGATFQISSTTQLCGLEPSDRIFHLLYGFRPHSASTLTGKNLHNALTTLHSLDSFLICKTSRTLFANIALNQPETRVLFTLLNANCYAFNLVLSPGMDGLEKLWIDLLNAI